MRRALGGAAILGQVGAIGVRNVTRNMSIVICLPWIFIIGILSGGAAQAQNLDQNFIRLQRMSG
jgi:hypothetical protein